jgi:hypothetical protein
MLVVASVVAASACASMQVHTYVPRGADLRTYHTYGWAPAGAFGTGDPRLDNNTLFIERLRSAVGQQLGRKNWRQVPAGDADLVIHFHARVDQRLKLTEPFELLDTRDQRDRGPQVYDAGTLLLDFVEPRSNTLVWRGWAEGTVDGVIDDQSWMNERIDAAVARILTTFPTNPVPASRSDRRPQPVPDRGRFPA